MLAELAAWDPTNNTTQRKKRFIPLFASIGAAIGSIVNAGQIKKIKKNIAILQEATILQDQQIMELARYADLTAARVRLHDTQIYRLQYGLLIVEDGIREMIDVSNFKFILVIMSLSHRLYSPDSKQDQLVLRITLIKSLSI